MLKHFVLFLSYVNTTGFLPPGDGNHTVRVSLVVPIDGGSLCCSVHAEEKSSRLKARAPDQLQRATSNVSHSLLDLFLFFYSWMSVFT
jgi:hypothetical protein